MATVTEKLARLKTLKKQIEVGEQFVLQYAVRDERMKDPLESGGGTKTVLAQKIQALNDLRAQYVRDRDSVAKSNAVTKVPVGKQIRTISEWLIWRREVANTYKIFLAALQQAVIRGRTVLSVPAHRQQEVGVSEIRIAVGIDEKVLGQEIEDFEVILGELDAQLSLSNATTQVPD